MAASNPTADFLLQVQTAAVAFAQATAPEAPAADFLLQLQTAAAAFAQATAAEAAELIKERADLNARLTAAEEANQKLQEEKEALRLGFRTAQEEKLKLLGIWKAENDAYGLMLAHKAQEFEDEFGWM